MTRRDDGGFSLAVEGRPPIRLEPREDGWRIEGVRRLSGWLLQRASGSDGGFILRGPDGAVESARTMPPVGTAGMPGPRFLLLEDGRLFTMVHRGSRDGGFELTGWETPGAYLAAHPVEGGWSLVPQPASGGLEDIQVISIMFAAEVLEAEEPLRTGKA